MVSKISSYHSCDDSSYICSYTYSVKYCDIPIVVFCCPAWLSLTNECSYTTCCPSPGIYFIYFATIHGVYLSPSMYIRLTLIWINTISSYVSLSTLVFNSKDQYGNLWLPQKASIKHNLTTTFPFKTLP